MKISIVGGSDIGIRIAEAISRDREVVVVNRHPMDAFEQIGYALGEYIAADASCIFGKQTQKSQHQEHLQEISRRQRRGSKS